MKIKINRTIVLLNKYKKTVGGKQMTNKSKRKVKEIIKKLCGITIGITIVGIMSIKLFNMENTSEITQMPALQETQVDEENKGDIEIITGTPSPISDAIVLANNVAEDGAIICDSIVQGARDNNLPDGKYTFRVVGSVDGRQETKDYIVEFINFYDDITYSVNEGQTAKTISLGDTTTEHKMLIVKYHKNLTIDKGVTVTATNVNNLTYKKGMYLCVLGELKNNGTISMTARGTYNQAGENVYLWKNTDQTFEYVPANGASGLAAKRPYTQGTGGVNGKNANGRGTGSGGQGASIVNTNNSAHNSYIGASSGGTSYSGGNGTGGMVRCNTSALSASATQASSTNGGAGSAYDGGSNTYYFAGGGAGTRGGNSSYCRIGNGNTQTKGADGTGGLLMLYANNLTNDGKIVSNGSSGAGAWCNLPGSYRGAVGGGGSGGGSINIFYNKAKNLGDITANGGAGGDVSKCTNNNMGIHNGGAGGNGSVTAINVMPELNYSEKEITIQVGDTYEIDKNEIQLVSEHKTQDSMLQLGNILYEILDTNIATNDENGIITGIKEGHTKIKIYDETNELETYMYINVIKGIKPMITTGTNFTIALKQNGTVWSYGKNDVGQLGSGNNENSNKPIQVYCDNTNTPLNNIVQISTGNSHSVAISSDGTVYTWGLNNKGQLGNGTNDNSNHAVKVEGLSNIKKVEAYKDMTIAIDNEGKLYTWGDGYTSLPMKKICSIKVVDVSGKLLLSNEGYIYDISNLNNRINNLSQIAKISCGVDHNLALSVYGNVYSWGTNNQYGELVRTSSSITANIAENSYNIIAGNDTTFVVKDDDTVWVAGCNTNGRIGLGTVAKVTTLTEIDIGKKIETVGKGHGTHSGISDTNGFVYMTGTNTLGELGNEKNSNVISFTKIGDTIIQTDAEKYYLDLQETREIIYKLVNTFNLKIDLIDDNKENFTLEVPDNTKLNVNDYNRVTAIGYGVNEVTITHNGTGKSKTIIINVIRKMNDIIKGIRDNDFTDGIYDILINGEIYNIEIYNIYEDTEYKLEEGQDSRTVLLGNDTADETMLIVKYHKNLTIDENVTLTASTRKKGMYICVLGDIMNYGEITMTARGANVEKGQNVFLWENIDKSYEYVPEDGAEGLAAYIASKRKAGNKGKIGTGRQTGGGGQGAVINNEAKGASNSYMGASTGGNSYAGGNGAGAFVRCNASGLPASYTQASKTKGGNGSAYDSNVPTQYFAGGAAGITGGNSSYSRWGTSGTQTKGQDGVGGLLMLYSDTLTNVGKISSQGSDGAGGTFRFTQRYNGAVGGAGSGGGSVNIFTRLVVNAGEVTAEGGKGGKIVATGANMGALNGGDGGDGTVTINELGSVLNYPVKKLTLNLDDTYIIDKNKLSYTKLNDIQTEDLTVGNIEFEVIDGTNIQIDETGTITPNGLGTAKVKITDTDNKYSTYIIIKVIEGIESDIKNGTEFTIALKENGTVWSYGSNNNGQLGNGLNEASNQPVQVIKEDGTILENIIKIDAHDNSAIALSQDGELYIWGLCYQGNTANKVNVATKVEGIQDIVEVSIKGDIFYVLDNNGNVYIWGKGHSNKTQLQSNIKFVYIDGELLLGEDGRVYRTTDVNTPLKYLSSICEISSGEDHDLFITLDGMAYSIGQGDLGQLGDIKNKQTEISSLVRTESGFLTNISKISAGNKSSIALDENGKVYVWGDNTNKKIGIEESKVNYAVELTNLQDKEGNQLNIAKMENVEIGKNHSSISDEEGYVYSVGLNTNGQLGTKDNIDRNIFTKIGDTKITNIPDEIILPINTSKDIVIELINTFNLKTDIAKGEKLEILSTNEKEIKVVEIENVDNSNIKDIRKVNENYTIIGEKIGRTNVIARNIDGYLKNIWINVVSDENAKVSAKVVNGNGFTIALKSDGTVWGFGNINDSNNPKEIQVPEEIIDITAGQGHSLLLGKSGTVYSMGTNTKGELGTGNVTTHKNPVAIDLNNIVKIQANMQTSFAIDSNGVMYAFGNGYTKTPTSIINNKNVIDASKTYYLTDEGKVIKTVTNEEIKISSNGITEEQERIMQISEGTNHILLLGESGKVYSLGNNLEGQLGDGSNISKEDNITTVVKTKDGNILENVTEISAGDKYSIVVTKDGKVYTFGNNNNQKLGISNDTEADGITKIEYATLKEDVEETMRVSAGYMHTAIYKNDGSVYTWGYGENGELGNSENFNYYSAQLVGKSIVETNTNNLVLQKGDSFDIDGWIEYFNLFENKQGEIEYEIIDAELANINRETGEVQAQNSGRTTIIAKEKGTDKIGVIQVRILENSKIEPMVETNGSHTITLKVDGTVWCYGIGSSGELGTGKKENSDEPVKAIFPEGTKIIQVAAGEKHCLALDEEGNVWAWGSNEYYQLGDTGSSRLVPTKINELSGITKIATGKYTSYAIGSSGEVYSFGQNANGEAGIGSYASKTTVKKSQNIANAVDIKAGENHAVVLMSTGEVYATGSNLYGQLAQDVNQIRRLKQFTKIQNLSKVVMIATGDNHNIALKSDGTIYTWGSNENEELGLQLKTNYVQTPTKVENVNDIRYIDGGSEYSLALNKQDEVFVCGENSLGELGNASKTDVQVFEKLNTIQDVIQLSGGSTYTVMVKKDGTVWGTGDYAHGDTQIKSKTQGEIPIQVGNDETGLTELEITLRKGESKNILDNNVFAFNLIYLEESAFDNLNFTSLRTDIATINNEGIVTGQRVGTTRVKATDTQKTYSVLVKVVEEDSNVAPKIEAGENFATVIKADGSIWSFGYNGDGRLVNGTNLSKDKPTETNINGYKEIKTGNNFVMILKEDGTVWTAGNNLKGQLGNGNFNSSNTLEQVVGLNNIVKISAGKNYAIAIDNLGNVYEWGNGKNTPEKAIQIGQRIIDVACGNNQTAYVTAKGTVIGIGNILNGKIEGIENAIKVQVTDNSIVILTNTEMVYEYKNGTTTKIEVPETVIDISAKGLNAMYQTASEKTYVSGLNTNGELGVGNTAGITIPELVQEHNSNTFGIGVGYANTYIIENTGNVYAAGNNEYGSIGNGTRNATQIHTLIGDRLLNIKPITATMISGNTETLQIDGNPFNVFKEVEIELQEYTIESDNEDVVTLNDQKLIAKKEGTAHINITDNVTGSKLELTRIVILPEQDRIEKITVDEKEANLKGTTEDELLLYRVELVTDEGTGQLKITTKDKTDRISIDGGTNWSNNGILEQEVQLINKITMIPIKVGIQNNEGEYINTVDYMLEVEKITDDTKVKEITVTETQADGTENSVIATKTDDTRYEAVVAPDTEISLTTIIANSEYSYISIDGKDYEKHEQNKNITIGEEKSIEIKFAVKSEAGTEKEYTLIIYKKDALLDLISLKVEGKEAQKVTETEYIAKISKDIEMANIVALVNSKLVSVSIDGNAYIPRKNEAQIQIQNEETTVIIKTKTEEGETKEYTLRIIKISQNTNLLNVQVDGNLAIFNEEDGNYHYQLTAATNKVIVKAVAEETAPNETWVSIKDIEYNLYENETEVNIIKKETKVKIKVKAEDGSEKEYMLIIEGLSDNTNIAKVVVNGKEATYIEGKNRYEIRSHEDNYEIEVTLEDILASMILGTNEEQVGIDTIEIAKAGEETIVTVKVISQSKLETETYTIAILEKSSNSSIDTILVNDKLVKQREDGVYYIGVANATTEINIKATAEDTYANTTIDGQANSSYIAQIIENVVDGKTIYEYEIVVTAENGIDKNIYNLVVEVLEANCNIIRVLAGETEDALNEATLKEDGNYYYKIGRVEKGNVKVELESIKSTVTVNGETGDVVIVDLLDEITTIPIVVEAEDGTIKEVSLIIEKKSDDVSLKEVIGDDLLKVEIEDSIVYVYVDEDANEVELTVKLNHEFAKLKIGEDKDYELNTITETIDLSNYAESGIVTADIDVVAEDGITQKIYTINIKKQADVDLESVVVNNDNIEYDEEKDGYFTIVANANRPEIVITAKNRLQTVQLINSSGTVLAQGTGVLTTTVNLSTIGLEDQYKIKVISHNGEDFGSKEYNLIIRQKSIETGIVFVKVDGLGTAVSEDKLTYSTVVAGKDIYIVDIKLVDEKAKVRIEDLNNNILIDNQTGNLTGNLEIIDDGQLKEFKVIVTAENGNEKEYKLQIDRISSNLELESITVTDYDLEEETIITKNVEVYNEDTKTYKVIINNTLSETQLNIKAVSQGTEITVDSIVNGTGSVETIKTLKEEAITRVTIKLKAQDGTVETRYLEIIKATDIAGKIITENVKGEHISVVTVYKMGETREKVAEATTKTDGSFKILMYITGEYDTEILNENYEVVVTKAGYLDYTVQNIKLEEGKEVRLDDYELIAGDVAVTGEIEIDDLVDLNDNLGVIITEENMSEMSIYDLNEDGVIDRLDRNILKKNYGKKSEVLDYSLINICEEMSIE